jgi:hypothetical protein
MFQDLVDNCHVTKGAVDSKRVHFAYIMYDDEIIISTSNNPRIHAEVSAITKLKNHHKYQYLKG